MEIIDVDRINRFQWNALVNESPTATWFQTEEAYLFFNSLLFLDAFALGVENEGRLKGVVVGYVQKDGRKIKQFFSRRAIVLGGPLLAEGITDEELDCLLVGVKSLLKGKAIYVETRNFVDYSLWRRVFEKCGFEYEPHLNFHVHCEDYDSVISNLKENRKRQIKKAVKEGAVIVEATNENEVMAFYDILKNLYVTKVKQPLFPLEFFLGVFCQEHVKLFLVSYNEKVIGGIVCPILDNRTIYEWYVCGNDLTFKKLYPSVMATWAAIEYAVKNGIEKFDFMGAGIPGKSYGVREFKEKFGGEMVEYGRYRYLFSPVLYAIGKIGVALLKMK